MDSQDWTPHSKVFPSSQLTGVGPGRRLRSAFCVNLSEGAPALNVFLLLRWETLELYRHTHAHMVRTHQLTKCALCVCTYVSPHTHCHISNRFLKEIAVGDVKYPLGNTMRSNHSCWSSLIRRTNSVSRSLPGFLHRSAPSQWLTEEELTNYQWVFLLSSRHDSQDCLTVDHPPQSRLKYLYNYWMEALW